MSTMSAPAIAVASFPRGGTSLTMCMLHAGGIEPVAGSQPGSYELPTIDDIVNIDRDALAGHSIKLLDTLIPFPDVLNATDDWKFIWLDRDPREQARSHYKLMHTFRPDFYRGLKREKIERNIRESFADDRLRAVSRLRRAGPLLILQFESILAEPRGAAVVIRDFLAPELNLDVDAASAVVRDRGPECQPDLSIELELGLLT